MKRGLNSHKFRLEEKEGKKVGRKMGTECQNRTKNEKQLQLTEFKTKIVTQHTTARAICREMAKLYFS